MTIEEAIDLRNNQLHPTIWAGVLSAQSKDGIALDVSCWESTPMDRLNDPDGMKYFVRARTSPGILADAEVTKQERNVSISSPCASHSGSGVSERAVQ
jgi:hypothetical protein